MVNIAILGHGVVGSGVMEVLSKNQKSIQRKTGQPIEAKYILVRHDYDAGYKEKFVGEFDTILNDPEISIVVEVMGGVHPAYEYVKASLQKGKSVVTSNKELVAVKGNELLKLAREHNCNFLFEASVGGGIPIIHPLHACLAANEIDEIAGILNGTTNFILTKMIKEQMSFDEALALAQKLGYAEKDPTADVEGFDACRKICILASLAFGRHVYPQQVEVEGITKITPEDVAYAEDCGCVIKLIGWVRHDSQTDTLVIRVCPALLSGDSQLASVDDVFNGILVRGDITGDVMFYGKGAGKLPTASAVVADVIEEAKNAQNIASLYWEDAPEHYVVDAKTAVISYYVRARVLDAAAAFETAKTMFGEITVLARENQPGDEIAFLTRQAQERSLDDGLAKFQSIADAKILGLIRRLDY